MHLLLIENDAQGARRLYDFLGPRGHIVDVAYDITSGIRFAAEAGHDAVVVSLGATGGDTPETCARLRDAGVDRPVVALLAQHALDLRLECLRRGADDYLVKPFAIAELEARLGALVRRARGETVSARMQVGDLSLDPARHDVRRAGRPLDLAPIPLRILALLMSQSPRVVPRQEIERRIWGNHRPDSDSLKVHMHALRRAIDHPFEMKLLQTVKRLGYRIAATEPATLPQAAGD